MIAPAEIVHGVFLSVMVFCAVAVKQDLFFDKRLQKFCNLLTFLLPTEKRN